MIIIGHRGAKGLAAENTLESIQKSLDNKTDMIELDVRMKSGLLVLSHDPVLLNKDYTRLSEALDLINGKVDLNLDIKEHKATKHLKRELANYNGRIVLSSHKYGILTNIRKNLPEKEIAIIEKWSGVRAVTEATLLDTRRIHIKQQWLWSSFVHSMNNQGFELYAYTVNNRERAKELESWGVKGIFTDYPDRFQ